MPTVPTISELYLAESGGDPKGFRDRLADGQRIGQAFFNSLSYLDQARLQGTAYDPFHHGMEHTPRAVEFLAGGIS